MAPPMGVKVVPGRWTPPTARSASACREAAAVKVALLTGGDGQAGGIGGHHRERWSPVRVAAVDRAVPAELVKTALYW